METNEESDLNDLRSSVYTFPSSVQNVIDQVCIFILFPKYSYFFFTLICKVKIYLQNLSINNVW